MRGAAIERLPLSPAARLTGAASERSLDRYVFNDVEQCSTTALFTARADGRSESLPPLDFCKACLWQVTDASSDLRDPNPNYLEHLECSHYPHIHGRGAQKRTQRAG